jgi:uncharacterized membrane protein (DUF2068 family)
MHLHLPHPDPNKPLEQRVGHSLLLVRLIAVSKLLKAAVLLFVGFFILHVIRVHGTAHDVLLSLVEAVRLDPHNHYLHGILEKTLGIHEGTLKLLSVGTLLYSALYTVEGIGLFFDKGWAEWMTVITTAGFLPLELYELSREITPIRVIIFVLNLLILTYIAMRLRWRHLRTLKERELAAATSPSPAPAAG